MIQTGLRTVNDVETTAGGHPDAATYASSPTRSAATACHCRT
jgi:hypothetical protein